MRKMKWASEQQVREALTAFTELQAYCSAEEDAEFLARNERAARTQQPLHRLQIDGPFIGIYGQVDDHEQLCERQQRGESCAAAKPHRK